MPPLTKRQKHGKANLPNPHKKYTDADVSTLPFFSSDVEDDVSTPPSFLSDDEEPFPHDAWEESLLSIEDEEHEDDDWIKSVDMELAEASSLSAGWRLPGKATYTGDSRASQWRKEKLAKVTKNVAVKHSQPLTVFFSVPPQISTPVSSTSKCTYPKTIDECIASLNKLASTGSACKFVKQYDHLRYMAMKRYFMLRQLNLSKMQASIQACTIIKILPSNFLSRCIRMWADHFMNFGALPVKKQGLHHKLESFVTHEDIALQCKSIFRGIKRNSRTAEAFMKAVNIEVADVQISLATAKRWLIKLGFFCGSIKKGVYKDGWADPDVRKDREERFVPLMLKYRCRMPTFLGEERDERVDPVNLLEKEILLCNHDECCFDTHSGRLQCWQEKGHTPITPKRGHVVMVSGILCQDGLLSTRIITPGTVAQFFKKIEIFGNFTNMAAPDFFGKRSNRALESGYYLLGMF